MLRSEGICSLKNIFLFVTAWSDISALCVATDVIINFQFLSSRETICALFSVIEAC